MIKLSIIIPMYNMAQYIERCLNSLVAQSLKELEVIIIDDASTDASLALAKHYAAKDERIKVIVQEINQGQGAARNLGLSVARGEYVWFVDADDALSEPDSAALLVSQAQEVHADILIFNVMYYFMDNSTNLLSRHRYAQTQGLNQQPQALAKYYEHFLRHESEGLASFDGMVWEKLYRLEFLRQYHFAFLNQRLYEDEISFLVPALAKVVHFSSHIGYSYFIRPGSAFDNDQPTQKYLENAYAIAYELLTSKVYQHLSTDIQLSATCFILDVYTKRMQHVVSAKNNRHQRKKLLALAYDQLREILQHCPSLLEIEEGSSLRLAHKLKPLKAIEASLSKPNISSSTKARLAGGIYRFARQERALRMVLAILPYGMLYLINKRYKLITRL